MHSRRAIQLAALVGVSTLLAAGRKRRAALSRWQGFDGEVRRLHRGRHYARRQVRSYADRIRSSPKGAGEVSMIATKSQPNHVLFDIKDGKAQVTLPAAVS